eukprot:g18324.t1
MSSYFKDHNFPAPVIENALDRISCVSCNSVLTPPSPNKNKDRIPLVLTYHPTTFQIHRIILRHFCHLQSDPTAKDIFPSPPLSALRRDLSLRHSLVRSTLTISPTSTGSCPCNHRKCYTCRYTSPLTSIQGTKKTFHIRQRFTCTSVNVVYCICCSQYGLLSIVANHFNCPSHSLDNMSILGILQSHNDANQKLEEQLFIFRVGSLQPNDLN